MTSQLSLINKIQKMQGFDDFHSGSFYTQPTDQEEHRLLLDHLEEMFQRQDEINEKLNSLLIIQDEKKKSSQKKRNWLSYEWDGLRQFQKRMAFEIEQLKQQHNKMAKSIDILQRRQTQIQVQQKQSLKNEYSMLNLQRNLNKIIKKQIIKNEEPAMRSCLIRRSRARKVRLTPLKIRENSEKKKNKTKIRNQSQSQSTKNLSQKAIVIKNRQLDDRRRTGERNLVKYYQLLDRFAKI